jgi:hypothetical protein
VVTRCSTQPGPCQARKDQYVVELLDATNALAYRRYGYVEGVEVGACGDATVAKVAIHVNVEAVVTGLKTGDLGGPGVMKRFRAVTRGHLSLPSLPRGQQ